MVEVIFFRIELETLPFLTAYIFIVISPKNVLARTNKAFQYGQHSEIYLLREASHIDFVHEKCHMDVLLETIPPHLETSRSFFDNLSCRLLD